MTQELIYTSAPQGLRPGSRGFCTVVSTQGMAVNLADRLESLSAYRHVFSPQDPNADLNPVVYSHLRIAVGGKQYHVLSRIAAAGLDYTQRSNKFAHHVVLDTSELVSAGPAWLLAQPAFMQTEWDGKPRILPVGRRPIAGTVEPDVCRHWQSAAGDAGWAGILAESANSGTKSVATVIYPPGMEVLGLVAESMSLLPPSRRWEISFSTYYTKLPPGVDCMWRFVLQGSPEAQAASRNPGAVVIDLCRPLGRAVGGPLVEAARTGHLSAAQHESAAVGQEVEANKGSVPAKGWAKFEQHENLYEVSRVPPPRQWVDGYGIGPPPAPKSIGLAAHSAMAWKPKKKTLTILIVVVAICVTFLFLLVGTGMLMWLRTHGIDKPVAKRADKSLVGTNVSGGDNLQAQSSSSAPPTNNSAATATTPNDAKKEQSATPSNENDAGNEQASQEKKADGNPVQVQAGPNDAPANEQQSDSQGSNTAASPTPAPQSASEHDGDQSFITSVEIVQKKNPQEYENRITIQEFSGEISEPISLRLIHPRLAKGLVYQLGSRRDGEGMSTWDVSVAGPQDSTTFGKFELTASVLTFKWDYEAVPRLSSYRALRNCLLEVRTAHHGEDQAPRRLLLRHVIELEPFAIGEYNGKPLIRRRDVEDMWPGVPIKLANICCDAPGSESRDTNIVVIGNAPREDGKLFFQLALKDASEEGNDYVRTCEVSLDYLGVKLPSKLTSGWGGTGPETSSVFHTYRLSNSQVQEWKDHVDIAIKNKQSEIEELNENRGNKEQNEDHDKKLHDEKQRLEEEKALAEAVSENLTVAQPAKINFAICLEVNDDGRILDVPLARTQER